MLVLGFKPVNNFDVIQRRSRIILFKLGKIWVFKHFFDDKEIFKAIAENYNEGKFRFEFNAFGARNQALKLLERAGFDYELVEDLRPFVVKISRYSKYAPLLKNHFGSSLFSVGNLRISILNP